MRPFDGAFIGSGWPPNVPSISCGTTLCHKVLAHEKPCYLLYLNQNALSLGPVRHPPIRVRYFIVPEQWKQSFYHYGWVSDTIPDFQMDFLLLLPKFPCYGMEWRFIGF